MTCVVEKRVNTSSPNGDQHQFSPNNIHTLSRDKVMRINEMITKRENALIFYQILSTTSLKKCIEISLENYYVDIEAFFSCRHEKLSGMV